jgi:bacterioferritin (cytochrome b1)
VEISYIEGNPALQDAEILRAGEIIDEIIRDCAVEAESRG